LGSGEVITIGSGSHHPATRTRTRRRPPARTEDLSLLDDAQRGPASPYRTFPFRCSSWAGIVCISLALMLVEGTHSSWAVTLSETILCFFDTGHDNPAVSEIALGALPESQSGLAAGAYDAVRKTGIALGTAALGAFIPTAGALGASLADPYVIGLHHAVLLAVAIAGRSSAPRPPRRSSAVVAAPSLDRSGVGGCAYQ
jgi:hypothetical protein